MYDIFYFGDGCLLCMYIFGVQVCYMGDYVLLLCMIVVGKVYCSDSDQIYLLMFYQVEGLLVDEYLIFVDLKGMLVEFVCVFFECDFEMCFCFSYFLFVEFGVEVDIVWQQFDGSICWLEVLGCGMVYLNVLCNVGIDLECYIGFVFGMGVECFVMFCYGVNDLCVFFENDV